MIKIENEQVRGWEPAIFGMRNPKNSWDESDSKWILDDTGVEMSGDYSFVIGKKDLHLMQTLADAGTDHGKFLRMIVVYADVTANHTFWAEFDTYKVGTVRNSCSKMHKIHAKEFEVDDFDHKGIDEVPDARTTFYHVVHTLENLRERFNETHEKKYWRAMIELLPMGFHLRATVMLNYAVLKNMYHARRNHKLDEWREFCSWIECLPYSELITGGKS